MSASSGPPRHAENEGSVAQAHAHAPASQIRQDPNAEPSSLQPSGLLNREAMTGKFSLRAILSTGEGDAAEAPGTTGSLPRDDPIDLGLVNSTIAKSLFENFMTVLNPYICQMDPVLHTYTYVRQRSSFLFTTMLAMAAKLFNTSIYKQLHEHAEELLSRCFRQGSKSAEIAQGALILTYWKEPQDTRAWTLVGWVIRMCIDLDWHKLKASLGDGRNDKSELERREVRNVERTWLVLFVYDRSISLQTGKPYMIERNDFIESIDTWCNNSISIANDFFLGALVRLRLETSVIFNLIVPKRFGRDGLSLHNVESLLMLINRRIMEWQNRWVQLAEEQDPPDEESCHPFLIRFYGTHLRLQVFSLPLQELLRASDPASSPSLEMLWVAYSSAMDMLRMIPQNSSRLFFAQDSIHIMIAYSAAFLIKLLVLAPESMTKEIESSTLEIIRDAATAFSQQAAQPGSSCALQAGFLDKVTSNLATRWRTESRAAGGQDMAIAQTSIQGNRPSSTRTPAQSRDWFILESVDPTSQEGTLDFQFVSDETWEHLFASAGFSTQDGVFLA